MYGWSGCVYSSSESATSTTPLELNGLRSMIEFLAGTAAQPQVQTVGADGAQVVCQFAQCQVVHVRPPTSPESRGGAFPP